MEAAFASHTDPLAGANAQTDPDELFRRIVYIVPPIGLGEAAWRRPLKSRSAERDCRRQGGSPPGAGWPRRLEVASLFVGSVQRP